MTTPRIGQTIAPQRTSNPAVEPSYVPELSADRITSGSITASTVEVGEDGAIRAGGALSYAELVADGLHGYVEGQEVFRLARGELYVKGTIEADNGYFSGDVVGATITGSTLIGGTITIGSGSSVFRASEQGIQLGSKDWNVAPFKVDLNGTMTATDANISGTIQSSGSGGRIRIGQSDQYGYPTGVIEFYSGLVGESPAAISARRPGVGVPQEIAIEAGYDPTAQIYGPKMLFRTEGVYDGTSYSTWNAIGQFYGTSFRFESTVSCRNITLDLPLNTTAAAQYDNTAVGMAPYDQYHGRCKVWSDAAQTVFIDGDLTASTAWSNGTVIGYLPQAYLNAYRSRRGFALVNGTTPVEIEVIGSSAGASGTPPAGAVVCRGAVTSGARATLHVVVPRIDMGLLA